MAGRRSGPGTCRVQYDQRCQRGSAGCSGGDGQRQLHPILRHRHERVFRPSSDGRSGVAATGTVKLYPCGELRAAIGKRRAEFRAANVWRSATERTGQWRQGLGRGTKRTCPSTCRGRGATASDLADAAWFHQGRDGLWQRHADPDGRLEPHFVHGARQIQGRRNPRRPEPRHEGGNQGSQSGSRRYGPDRDVLRLQRLRWRAVSNEDRGGTGWIPGVGFDRRERHPQCAARCCHSRDGAIGDHRAGADGQHEACGRCLAHYGRLAS